MIEINLFDVLGLALGVVGIIFAVVSRRALRLTQQRAKVLEQHLHAAQVERALAEGKASEAVEREKIRKLNKALDKTTQRMEARIRQEADKEDLNGLADLFNESFHVIP